MDFVTAELIEMKLKIFVSCAKGLQYALEQELISLGVGQTHAIPGGVGCEVTIRDCYRILLWSRIASRVILNLCNEKVSSVDDIYDVAKAVNWSDHFTVDDSFAIRFVGTNAFVRNSTFGGLKVKDGIVDRFRELSGKRPDISKESPNISLHAHLAKGRLSLGIDLSGEGLHKRHYRTEKGAAPLRENLAAGILQLSGWPHKISPAGSLCDPMCGSGTFLIEAAQMMLNYAPGLKREHWGFDHWRGHQPAIWEEVQQEALEKHQTACRSVKRKIVGFDQDPKVIAKAWSNIERAGFQDYIHVEKRQLSDFECFEGLNEGLLIVNPPYGERLGEIESLGPLYKQLGQVFEQFLMGWKAAVLTGHEQLGRQIGWRSHKQYKLLNGPIESLLLLFELKEQNRFKSEWMSPEQRLSNPLHWRVSHSQRAEMFANRLKKNTKVLGKWLRKQEISCYRLYDADMPEYAIAIDVYQDLDGQINLHVQEYAAPDSVDEKSAVERLSEALAVIRDTLSVPAGQIVLKSRMAQKGKDQYSKRDESREFKQVREGPALFWVNLKDYLDTGLFLDHRPMRRWMFDNADGARVLNLFCYTASVTVYAALGGARSSLSLDMSATYLRWAKRNYELNDVDEDRHTLRRVDCTQWLREEGDEHGFDIIFLDPPSFSNSKNMDGVLDIQRDHEELIELSMRKLSANGVLIFSNNLRKFKLASGLKKRYQVEDWNRRSLDKDFERNPRIHHCWSIRRLNSE